MKHFLNKNKGERDRQMVFDENIGTTHGLRQSLHQLCGIWTALDFAKGMPSALGLFDTTSGAARWNKDLKCGI